ncbi:hypothetical protein CspeluHIS016_0802850 [Cutaneotrichosporon spelunceum]|uniref:Oxidoreductase-like domain-containing protein n=1 Tax=Cutaneotrichosporon spelunceum TaxID=1672016 RepID=A0AAD3YF36_9TREE|nr:hypothetical protein CspeluHIS016_0802850 [Cutaneotrichosporon spelunceum]
MTTTTFQGPLDEEYARDWVFEYSEARRMAPYRANIILEKALDDNEPARPDEDECCGASCCPCVLDLWREEVAVWKAVRDGTDVETVATRKNFSS